MDASIMLGTKLLLLCCIVYASGQGVSYNGGSNVRTQSRLPPRSLGPYRPPSQPIEQIRPVYNPQPVNQPQPAPIQPVYQPLQPELSTAKPQPMQPLQPVYQPRQPVYQPPQLVYERPTETPAPEIPPQPIYEPIPPNPAIPSQPRPRPLPSWSWRPVQSTEAPIQIITQETATPAIEAIYPEQSSTISPKAVNPEVPEYSISELTSEEPVIVLLPDPPMPEIALTLEEPQQEPKPEPVPESVPEISPEEKPEQLFIDPEPVNLGYYQTPRPTPIPLPTSAPEIIQEPTPETISEPIYQPIPEAPVDTQLPLAGLPPIQPVLPPRPNYRPIPTAPAPTQPSSTPQPAPVPLPPSPNYRPLPPAPIVPIPPRPSPTQPPAPRPNYEPIRPSTPYPIPVSSYAPVPTQPPVQPTSYPVVPPTSVGPLPGGPDISLIIPINNFECSNGNGYYRINNECDTYIKCENRRAYKFSCPDGLHFNPKAVYPEYPCAYPSQVQCEVTASKQIARPTNECPNRYGFFSISGGDCSKYIMCQEGQATIMNCPFGLVFNDQLSSCDWPENVPRCNPKAFKDFACPIPSADDPDELTRHRYGSDCGMYVACQRGHPRLLKCDVGMSFDVSSQVCIDSDLIPECSRMQY